MHATRRPRDGLLIDPAGGLACAILPSMSEVKIEVETSFESVEELRPVLDAALKEQFPGGMLQRRWDGDVLRLSGPGAEGSIVLEEGKVIGSANLKPPASLMRGMIEGKIAAALAKLVS